jgi:LAO/AO transport system kinase
MDNQNNFIQKILKGDVRAIARAISLIEEQGESARELLRTLFSKSGRAHVIGVTGSPGAGKSTLVDQLANALAKDDKRVAVLAVDPSSPFTGGALLGDRIRMDRAVEKENVYVRSMASRGALGGLAPSTNEAIIVLDAAGFDYVIVETVGVGQAEVEVVKSADTVVVVLVPGMGDTVQALKAGILEIADIFVINKADYAGADRLFKEIRSMLELAEDDVASPEIVKTIATKGDGVEELTQKLLKHLELSIKSGQRAKRREEFLLRAIKSEVSKQALEAVLAQAESSGKLEAELRLLRLKNTDPLSAAESLLKDVLKKK